MDWFATLAAGKCLPEEAAVCLDMEGFAILPEVIPAERLENVAHAYTAAELSALEPDKRIGSTSTRVSDFVNRGEEFSAIYLFPPLLSACCRVIGRPFKLSSFQSRTVHPHAAAQDLHVDVKRESTDWPLLSFILMIDEFRSDNGATRFIPNSHQSICLPDNEDGAVLACGAAGSLLIFNGSTWHSHSENKSDRSRRSLQGAFIPREGKSAINFAARMPAERRDQLSALAKYILDV